MILGAEHLHQRSAGILLGGCDFITLRLLVVSWFWRFLIDLEDGIRGKRNLESTNLNGELVPLSPSPKLFGVDSL